VFFGPDVEGDRCDFVDYWNCVAVFGQVDGFEVGVAGFAGVDADVVEFAGDVDGELFFVLFAAGGADHAAVLPFCRAEGTEEPALGSFAFAAQNGSDRARVAEGTDGVGVFVDDVAARGEIFGVGLQQDSREEAGGFRAGEFVERRVFPESEEQFFLRGGGQQIFLAVFGERGGANASD